MDSLTQQRINATARLAASLLTAANALLAVAGKNPLPFTDEQAGTAVSVIIMVAATLWAWWKDNIITSAAHIGHDVMTAEKTAAKTGVKTIASPTDADAGKDSTGMTENELSAVLEAWRAEEADQ